MHEQLKNPRTFFYVLSTFALSLAIFATSAFAHSLSDEEDASRSPASLEQASRLLNVHELVGPLYQQSVVRNAERLTDVHQYLLNWTRKSLQGKYKRQARKLTDAIIEESDRYGFDPILVASIISTESRFNPRTIGGVGEIGLMQIRPETAKWIAAKYNLPFHGRKNLFDMVTNVRIGTAFLSYLREEFNAHGRLYLAAYNMGENKVRTNVGHRRWPKEYALRVMKQYLKYYSKINQSLNEKALAMAVEEEVAQD